MNGSVTLRDTIDRIHARTIAEARARRTDPLLDALRDAAPLTATELIEEDRRRRQRLTRLANQADRLFAAEVARR